MLIGQKAPAVVCQAIINGEIKDFNLDNLGSTYKILFFYPLDFTFVCPTELHAFQDILTDFERRNTNILGISVDSVYSHQAWLAQPREKGGIAGIAYPLLSDITKNISRAYGVLDEQAGIAFRGLFILDKDNIVQAIQINNLSLGRSIHEVLRLLDALQFVEKQGQVCPANWAANEAGLEPTRSGLAEYFTKK